MCADVLRAKPLVALADRFWAKVDKSESCWVWTAGTVPGGYGFIRMRGREKTSGMAHRISWELHNGPVPTGMYVMHICDNPPCVRPDHLRLGTPQENTQDAIAKGRHRGQRKLHQSLEQYPPAIPASAMSQKA